MNERQEKRQFSRALNLIKYIRKSKLLFALFSFSNMAKLAFGLCENNFFLMKKQMNLSKFKNQHFKVLEQIRKYLIKDSENHLMEKLHLINF